MAEAPQSLNGERPKEAALTKRAPGASARAASTQRRRSRTSGRIRYRKKIRFRKDITSACP